MSLINRLLQDLDKRRSRQTEDVQIPRGARATTESARTSMPGAKAWLLALLVCAVAAATYLWQTDSRLASKVDGLLADVRDTPPASAENTLNPEITVAQVEAALMIPVFQLSNELASPPRTSPLALGVDTSAVASREKREAKAPVPRNGSGSGRKAAVSTPDPKPQRVAETAPVKQPEKRSVALAASLDVAKSTAPVKRSADTARQPDVSRSDSLEEIVIPADLPVSPIEKQARQLTPYERAESDFRKGVASLRQGRMSGAEEYFRSAIEEDRSHVAARQALIGILIDAGRNGDAEAVLSEALSINPRQPREAIILARLQVERGDLDAALRTLEGVSTYAGADAGYFSFLAAVFQRASQHEEAAKQYRNALALMPRNAIWMMGLGISLKALGDRDGAKDAFGRAAATGTLNPELQAFVVQQYTALELAAR